MSEKIIHEKIRREMDNYINHAKSKGFTTEGYGNFQSYCHLLHEVLIIHLENNKIEKEEKE